MLDQYYLEELAQLRELGADFAKAHPALAPKLSGSSSDPDVERLLEGVAFLTSLLRRKLDDEFPEIIYDLTQILMPHYLRPIPSTTVVVFSPKPTLRQSLTIPAGIPIASIPVADGVSCGFQTRAAVEIHPVSLADASFSQPPGRPAVIKLALKLTNLRLSAWQPRSLRFFLSGDRAAATDLYLLLLRHLKRIVIRPAENGGSCALPPESLRPCGFAAGESLFPYPSQSFPGYRLLQEYFVFPEKFLFIDLVGWERWTDRGDGERFEIEFELDELPFGPPRIKPDSFVLFATPAVNLFAHEAVPILLDHRRVEYPIRPVANDPAHFQIFSVDNVVGFVRGTAEERAYAPFEFFNPVSAAKPVFKVTQRESPLRPGPDTFLSVTYPEQAGVPVAETLSVQLTCTNGALPEKLQVGDICRPTSGSPEFVDFTNSKPPTPLVLPPLGRNLTWRLLSHLSLNHLSLAKAEHLKTVLNLYLFPDASNRTLTLANKKRIEGIEQVESRLADRLVSGVMLRGQEISLQLRQDHFASPGDLFLFGAVLDHFLGSFAAINTFTRLNVRETAKGTIYQWPARLGNRPLI